MRKNIDYEENEGREKTWKKSPVYNWGPWRKKVKQLNRAYSQNYNATKLSEKKIECASGKDLPCTTERTLKAINAKTYFSEFIGL